VGKDIRVVLSAFLLIIIIVSNIVIIANGKTTQAGNSGTVAVGSMLGVG
jgi:hypothetical protein